MNPDLPLRTYGNSGPWVIVLHGGPGAPGSAAPLARGLADAFRVLEPWQQGSGDDPLSVARHVEDLHQLILSRCRDGKPALVGESWGAMLALAYSAAHPDTAGPIVLVGCGTFDPAARARMKAILEERTSPPLRHRLERLATDYPDPAERLKKHYDLIRPLYDYDAEEEGPEEGPNESFDLRAHTETWDDMVRLQEEGVYPEAFAAIRSPVLMLHGAYDPHPGRMILASFAPYLPRIEYREWEQCGHRPWAEKHVREEFFASLRNWLAMKMEGSRDYPSPPPSGVEDTPQA